MYIPYLITQWLLISLLIGIVISAIFFSTIPYGKKLVIRFLDWYICGNYSAQYIHRDLIRAEISKRIKEAVDKTNAERDEQEEGKLKALKDIHKIEEDGYIAEIMRLEKNDENVKRLQKINEDLYFKVVRRVKELMLITAENWHEGEKIINDVSASIGRLDAIKGNTQTLVDEIERTRKDDYIALGLGEKDTK